MEVRRLIDVNYIDEFGNPQVVQMYETLHGVTKETPIGVKWNFCSVCLMDFPEREMIKIKGKWYCKKYKCFEDTMPKEIQKT